MNMMREAAAHLVRNRSRMMTIEMIAKDTKLPHHWIEDFAQGRVQGLTVDRVQILYEYLAKRKIEF